MLSHARDMSRRPSRQTDVQGRESGPALDAGPPESRHMHEDGYAETSEVSRGSMDATYDSVPSDEAWSDELDEDDLLSEP